MRKLILTTTILLFLSTSSVFAGGNDDVILGITAYGGSGDSSGKNVSVESASYIGDWLETDSTLFMWGDEVCYYIESIIVCHS